MLRFIWDCHNTVHSGSADAMRMCTGTMLPNDCLQADSAIMMGLFAPSGVAKATLATIPLLGTCISAFQVNKIYCIHRRHAS